MIDYQKFGMAQRHYLSNGFNYIEVPWLASKEAIYSTKLSSPNKDVRDYETFSGYLVASGEQSFVQLMLDNKLPVGKSFCITPCFRDEVCLSDITKEYFLKLELIHYMDFKESDLFTMIDIVKTFFYHYIHVENLLTTKTDIGYDLEVLTNNNKIEVGSFGIRTYEDHKWIYGTGLAEPRFSYSRKNEREIN